LADEAHDLSDIDEEEEGRDPQSEQERRYPPREGRRPDYYIKDMADYDWLKAKGTIMTMRK